MTNDVLLLLFSGAGFDKSAQGLAGAGRRLAQQTGGILQALVVGAFDEAQISGIAQVADVVTIAAQPELVDYQPETCLTALAELCRNGVPGVVLLSNDTYSQEIAPRLAHRLGGSAAGDAIAVTAGSDGIRVTRPVYGGKAQAIVALKRKPAVVSLRARAFAPEAPRAEAVPVGHAEVAIPAGVRTRIVERQVAGKGETRLEDARVIVSGGRGIGGADGFANELQPLAQLLGGQIAASRAACDAGWVPPTLQVGQTGKKVAPDLYLAIGITGASQHMAGISDAKQIAAINIDRDAPIFKHCRFGIVEDYRKVVPLLREKLAAMQK